MKKQLSLLEYLSKVTPNQVSKFILALVPTIVPGITWIYLFREDLLIQFDVFKLVFTATIVTVPTLFLNLFIVNYADHIYKRDLGTEKITILALYINALSLYGVLAILSLLKTDSIMFLRCFVLSDLVGLGLYLREAKRQYLSNEKGKLVIPGVRQD